MKNSALFLFTSFVLALMLSLELLFSDYQLPSISCLLDTRNDILLKEYCHEWQSFFGPPIKGPLSSALSEREHISEILSPAKNNTTPNSTKPLRITTTLNPEYITLFIAKEMGFFNQSGIPIQLIVNENYSSSEMTYLNGVADAIIEPLSDSIFRNSYTSNLSTFFSRVVYVNDYSTTADVILGKIDNLKSLKGKILGADSSKSYSKTFVIQALKKAGLTEKDVQVVSVLPQQLVKALENGSMAAAHIWGPTKSQLVEDGFHVLFSANEIPGIIADVLVFKSKVVKERPKDIQLIVTALDKSRQFVDSNTTEAFKTLNKNLGFSEEELTDRIGDIHLLNLTENRLAMKQSNQTMSLYTSGKIIASTFLDDGEIDGLVQLPRMIAARFVNSVNP